MSKIRMALLAATLLAGGAGGLAYAQQAPQPAAATQPVYDPAQLPQIQGKVAQYSLTPRGEVDGVILDDGTQVHFGPRMSTELVFAVRPGDAVTIHGLKAKVLPLVMAMSITNDATHQTVADAGPHGPHMGMMGSGSQIAGQIKAPLYGPRGEVNGVLLADGTEVRLPPPAAVKLADVLAAGKQVVVRGEETDTPLGKLMMARAIGPDANNLTRIMMPHPGEHGIWHAKFGHDPHGHGPEGAGPGGPGGPGAPDGDAPPPPPPAAGQ